MRETQKNVYNARGIRFDAQEATIAPTKKKAVKKAAPAAKKPVAKKAVAKKPAAPKAAPKKAVAKKPAAAPKKPAAKATPKAAVKKAAAPKPAAVKSAPAAKKPAAPAKKGTGHKMFDLVMEALGKEKGENLISINLAGKSAIADYMVIVSGTSSRHVGAMAEKLKQALGKEGFRCRIEGKGTGDWVILDAGDVIVHLFRPEVRSFYNLEKLWMSDFSTVGYNLYTSE